MFIYERRQNQNKRRIVNRTQATYPAKQDEEYKQQRVYDLRQTQAGRYTEFYDHRTKPGTLIKIVVLDCIDQVKTDKPEQHAESQHQWRSGKLSPHCKPGSNRCDGEREAEKKLRKRSKTLGKRIEKDN